MLKVHIHCLMLNLADIEWKITLKNFVRIMESEERIDSSLCYSILQQFLTVLGRGMGPSRGASPAQRLSPLILRFLRTAIR